MSDGSGIITICCQVLGFCVVIISKKCETHLMVIYITPLCCYVNFVFNFYSVMIPVLCMKFDMLIDCSIYIYEHSSYVRIYNCSNGMKLCM
jgi:hypothetical protein